MHLVPRSVHAPSRHFVCRVLPFTLFPERFAYRQRTYNQHVGFSSLPFSLPSFVQKHDRVKVGNCNKLLR